MTGYILKKLPMKDAVLANARVLDVEKRGEHNVRMMIFFAKKFQTVRVDQQEAQYVNCYCVLNFIIYRLIVRGCVFLMLIFLLSQKHLRKLKHMILTLLTIFKWSYLTLEGFKSYHCSCVIENRTTFLFFKIFLHNHLVF